jgi:hypothetical protein
MERRVRPVRDARYQAMLDRIEMDVVDMTREIVAVADRVLPEPPLPQRKIAIAVALQRGPSLDQRAGEMPLDPTPSTGKSASSIGKVISACR